MSTDDTRTTTDEPGSTSRDAQVRLILDAIVAVAPELEPELADLDPDIDFWTEFELDSMDHLAVMTRLSEETGVEIPEQDYPRLTTVNALCDHLGRDG